MIDSGQYSDDQFYYKHSLAVLDVDNSSAWAATGLSDFDETRDTILLMYMCFDSLVDDGC